MCTRGFILNKSIRKFALFRPALFRPDPLAREPGYTKPILPDVAKEPGHILHIRADVAREPGHTELMLTNVTDTLV